jgi:menaquinone-dependent protoporphyrinogen oxidase
MEEKGKSMSTLKTRYGLTSSVCRYSICLSVLLSFFACSVSAFASPRTDDDLIEMTCGEEYSKYLLIAYDTIHGSTAEVAEYIGNDLCNQGFRVDLRLVTNVENISEYDAIIVGSAIYQFTWLKDAKNFLQQNQATLAQLPTAYFIVGASMSVDTPESREAVKKAFVDPVLEEFPDITPLSIGLFGGAVDFDTNDYNLFEWIVLKILGLILGYTEGADWRNWDAIDTWSKELAGEL